MCYIEAVLRGSSNSSRSRSIYAGRQTDKQNDKRIDLQMDDRRNEGTDGRNVISRKGEAKHTFEHKKFVKLLKRYWFTILLRYRIDFFASISRPSRSVAATHGFVMAVWRYQNNWLTFENICEMDFLLLILWLWLWPTICIGVIPSNKPLQYIHKLMKFMNSLGGNFWVGILFARRHKPKRLYLCMTKIKLIVKLFRLAGIPCCKL